MIVLESYNIEKDFWEENPQLVLPVQFKNLREGKLELKGDIMSSMVMWAIALVHDYNSKYFNLPIAEREKLIEEEYLGMPRFFKDNRVRMVNLVDQYNYLQKDSEVRFLEVWNMKVDEISKVIRKHHATKDNIKELTTLLLNQENLMKQKDAIMDRLEKSNINLGVRGGGELSLIESERI